MRTSVGGYLDMFRMKVRYHSHKLIVGLKTEDIIKTAVHGCCGSYISDKQGKCGLKNVLPQTCNHGYVFIGSLQLMIAKFFFGKKTASGY